MATSAEKVPVTTRLAPEVADRLIELATEDRRSLSAYLEILIEQHVKEKDGE